jgi:hypothetical protein
MVPDDVHGYRVALIESFRQWGIVLEGVRTHSEEHLRWTFAHEFEAGVWQELNKPFQELRTLVGDSLYFQKREEAFTAFTAAQLNLHENLRKLLSDETDEPIRKQFERITGLVLSEASGLVGLKDDSWGMPRFEVHAIRPAFRVTPSGEILKQVIITITQRRKVPLDPTDVDPASAKIIFRGGSTLILDLETLNVRYAITRRINDEERLERIRTYRTQKADGDISMRATYFGSTQTDETEAASDGAAEPFALLHSDE